MASVMVSRRESKTLGVASALLSKLQWMLVETVIAARAGIMLLLPRNNELKNTRAGTLLI